MSLSPEPLIVLPLLGLPEIGAGDDLATLIRRAAGPTGLHDGDVLVVSSKLVSKALGLRTHWAGDRETKEALVRRETRRVVAERRTPEGTTCIVEAVAGPVMAAAGIDASNTGDQGGLLSLPDDPDREAAALRRAVLDASTGLTRLGVVLSDTAGRPWRLGQVDLALGSAGVAVTDDLRGGHDHDGRPLGVTTRAVADEIASAADLVKGKRDGVGAVVVRGLPASWVLADPPSSARHLVRTGPGDWFALGHVEAVRAALGVTPGSETSTAVGVPAVHREDLAARAARTLRAALAAGPATRVDTAGAPTEDADSWSARLVAPDEMTLGIALGRLDVSGRVEGVAWRWTTEGPRAEVVAVDAPS